ncbi:MAG TPA: zf-HC2 domain-containing protein [Gemmatimonadaceae bacterium]|nr:zf-HC2 domain-containing protein [Gemmatimonadaceae bacterium]
MTNHPDDALLHDFVDGRLADDDREAVAFHLLDCPRCQTIVAATEELIDTGRSAKREANAPADLWPLVAATTIHERAVRRHVLKSVRRELALAAAVLILLSGAAGAFGMRIAMRAENGFGGSARVDTRVAPKIAISGLEDLDKLEELTKLEAFRVDAGGHGIGIGGNIPEPPDPPGAFFAPPSPSATETARHLANEFVTGLMARESRAFVELRDLGVSPRRIAEIEDSLFQTNRRLSQLRLAYINVPDNASVAEELEDLFDQRIALIRKAAAEAESRSRP